MAGKKKTRATIEAACAEAGVPPPVRGESLTPLLRQAAIVAEVQKKKAAEANRVAREKSDRLRKAAGVRPIAHKKVTPGDGESAVPQDVSVDDIKGVLKTILMSTSEPGTARIRAAETLLQMDGTAPEYQKALLEVRLTSYTSNQFEKDVARHEARA